jgi:hypothetical protein
MIGRDRKILPIAQAHVAPGMSLVKWQEILVSFAVFPDEAGTWSGISDDQVDRVFEEIAGIVKAVRVQRADEVAGPSTGPLRLGSGQAPQTIKPIDLYRP